MEQQFNEPQRQSAAGIAVLFVNNLQHSIRILVIPIVLFIVKNKTGNLYYILIGLLIFVCLLALYSYLSYLRFTFFLDEKRQEFVIRKGIINKNQLTIPLDKIQQVNINQSLIQQVIGVYSLEIDTAGSDKKEADIRAIDHLTATRLRTRLLQRTAPAASVSETPEHTESQQKLLKLSLGTLFKVGLTSNYGASLALLSGFVFAIFEGLRNYTEALNLKENPLDRITSQSLNLFSICFLFGIIILILLLTNVIRTFLKYYNFEITRKPHALAISAGLLTKHNTLLNPDKVQISAYSQNYFQKKLGLLNMKIKEASYAAADSSGTDQKKSSIDIPGCDTRERDEVLQMIFDRMPIKGTMFIPNFRFIAFNIFTDVMIPVALFLSLGDRLLPVLKPYFLLTIPYTIIVCLLLYFEFIHHRLYVSEDYIIKKSGIWDIAYEILEPHKIQSVTAKQFFWQKSANVGHLILHTAAGSIHFKYGNYTEIHRMVNYWLYKLESGKKDWM